MRNLFYGSVIFLMALTGVLVSFFSPYYTLDEIYPEIPEGSLLRKPYPEGFENIMQRGFYAQS